MYEKKWKSIYVSLLQYCCSNSELHPSYGLRLHAHIGRAGPNLDPSVQALLIRTYGRYGLLKEHAWPLFAKSTRKDLPSWNAMISAYAQNGHYLEAVNLFEEMVSYEGLKLDNFSFVPVLSAFAHLRVLSGAKRVHSYLVSSGTPCDVVTETSLVNAYGKCGCMMDSRRIFDAMPALRWNQVSWNCIIAIYAQNEGRGTEALELLARMDSEGIRANRITYLLALEACSNTRDLENCRSIHKRIDEPEFFLDGSLRNALVNAYGKCGSVSEARAVFDGIINRNIVSWTTMIATYTHNGNNDNVMQLFRSMIIEGGGMKLDKIAFLSLLDACSASASLENGRLIHAHIAAIGLESDPSLQIAMLNMYGKCCNLRVANSVFEHMRERDVYTWTALIGCYTHSGHNKEAVDLFWRMNVEGVKADRIAFLSVFDACSKLRPCSRSQDSRVIHAFVLANGFGADISIGNALINTYGKCHSIRESRAVFDRMLKHDAVSYNSMIKMHAQHGEGECALELFREMGSEGIRVDKITLLCVIGTCASLGSLHTIREVYKWISSSSDSELNNTLKNALISAFAKCGGLPEARTVFGGMRQPDAVSWNSVISACAKNGHSQTALQIFAKMIIGNIEPDHVTFVNVLHACSHAGLPAEGRASFISMQHEHGIAPSLDHFLCMLDLLGRSGCHSEAEDLFRNMPVKAESVAWTTLLSVPTPNAWKR